MTTRRVKIQSPEHLQNLRLSMLCQNVVAGMVRERYVRSAEERLLNARRRGQASIFIDSALYFHETPKLINIGAPEVKA